MGRFRASTRDFDTLFLLFPNHFKHLPTHNTFGIEDWVFMCFEAVLMWASSYELCTQKAPYNLHLLSTHPLQYPFSIFKFTHFTTRLLYIVHIVYLFPKWTCITFMPNLVAYETFKRIVCVILIMWFGVRGIRPNVWSMLGVCYGLN